MTTLILAVWKLVGWRGLLVGAAVAFAAYWHFSAISEAYDDGAQSVRLEWQESRRREELAALERQRQQQAEINRVEIDLLNSRALSANRIRSLEEALEAERAENETNGVDLSVCRLSDRMRDQLLYNRP
jgi:hypothetical protein